MSRGLDRDLAGARASARGGRGPSPSRPPSWASGPRRTSTPSPPPHCGCTRRSTRRAAGRSGTSPAAWPRSTRPREGWPPILPPPGPAAGTSRRRPTGRRSPSPSLPIAMGIALPAAIPAPSRRARPSAPRSATLPRWPASPPALPERHRGGLHPPFNGRGAPQKFMLTGAAHRAALDQRGRARDRHRRPRLRPGPGALRAGERGVDAERRHHEDPGVGAVHGRARRARSATRPLRLPRQHRRPRALAGRPPTPHRWSSTTPTSW